MSNHLNPHDRLFRSMMTKPKVIKEFFSSYLPAHIRKQVDLNSIALQKESFIDDKLRMQITDILCTAQFGKKLGYLYVLVEHQSKPDRFMPYRLLKYKTAIMDHHLKKTKSKELPIIYPLILYSGRVSYSHSTDIFDLFGDHRKLAESIFYRPYQLIDLQQIPDEELKSQIWFGVMARMMKHIYKKDIMPYFKSALSELKDIEKNGDWDYIYSILTYLFEAGEIKDQEDFVETIKTGLSVKEEKIMTLAERYRTEGKKEGHVEGLAEGIEKGIEKGHKEIALKLLLEGSMDIKHISLLTDIPVEKLKALKKSKIS